MSAKKLTILLLLGLALFAPEVHCQDDDDYDAEEPPEDEPEEPPAASDQKELTTLEEFEEFINHDDATVVGAFPAKEMPDPNGVKPEGWDDEEDGEWAAEVITTPQLAAFNQAAASLYNFKFAYTVAPEVLAKLKVTKGAVFLYRSPQWVSKEHGDRPRERFPSDSISEATLSTWLKSKAQPLVGKWSYATKERYDHHKAVAIVFFNLDFEKNAKGVAYVLKRARKAAAELKAKGVAVAVASSDDSYDLEDYGLEAKNKNSDILVGIKAGEKHYGLSAAFSGPALLSFVESYLKGELTAHVRPPPPPYEPPSDNEDDYGGEGDEGEGDEGEDNEAYGDDEEGGEEKEEM